MKVHHVFSLRAFIIFPLVFWYLIHFELICIYDTKCHLHSFVFFVCAVLGFGGCVCVCVVPRASYTLVKPLGLSYTPAGPRTCTCQSAAPLLSFLHGEQLGTSHSQLPMMCGSFLGLFSLFVCPLPIAQSPNYNCFVVSFWGFLFGFEVSFKMKTLCFVCLSKFL